MAAELEPLGTYNPHTSARSQRFPPICIYGMAETLSTLGSEEDYAPGFRSPRRRRGPYVLMETYVLGDTRSLR